LIFKGWFNKAIPFWYILQVHFMIYKDTMNAKTFLKFVKRLIRDATQEIILIRMFQKKSNRVQKYFEHDKIAYAV